MAFVTAKLAYEFFEESELKNKNLFAKLDAKKWKNTFRFLTRVVEKRSIESKASHLAVFAGNLLSHYDEHKFLKRNKHIDLDKLIAENYFTIKDAHQKQESKAGRYYSLVLEWIFSLMIISKDVDVSDVPYLEKMRSMLELLNSVPIHEGCYIKQSAPNIIGNLLGLFLAYDCFVAINIEESHKLESRQRRREDLIGDPINYDVNAAVQASMNEYQPQRSFCRNPNLIVVEDGFSGEEKCSVCLDSGNNSVVKTLCGHLYHKDCLTSWLSNNRTCPLCRADCETGEP